MYLLGFDLGSSSVKVSIIQSNTGEIVASAQSPADEMNIVAASEGWAEQDPEMWIRNAIAAVFIVKKKSQIDFSKIQAIGISYQMHGLVVLDKEGQVLRPSIIWCDSRAVETGNKAFAELGPDYCLGNLLNSPGNFTASKLRWVKDHEPELYAKIHKIMLPGDYLAYRLTGEIHTTQSGLSEGIMWDFRNGKLAQKLLDIYEIDKNLIPEVVDTFTIQGVTTQNASTEFGLPPGIPVSYRAGDQPNNAFSLNVLKPGELAATAGTSGVVYGISKEIKYDDKSRVNTFLHVNNTPDNTRLGVLLCINGTGILNSWLRRNIADGMSYEQMNAASESIAPGSEGLLFYPFGNGAERMLGNQAPGAEMKGLNLNIHTRAHMLRAAQEGIVFSFIYGMEIMQQLGINTKTIKAGMANMFLSPVFRETLAGASGAVIELYNTDGAAGAARGAGVGAGVYKSFEEAFLSLKKLDEIAIHPDKQEPYKQAYNNWLQNFNY